MRRGWSAEEFGEPWTLGPAELALVAGLPDAGKLGLAAKPRGSYRLRTSKSA